MSEDHPIPDVYSDRFGVNADPLGAVIVLSRSQAPKPGAPLGSAENVATLRFSLENWKVILMTGRKHLKEHETKLGAPIHLSKELLTSLNLTEADW